jgi:hypothetical protein
MTVMDTLAYKLLLVQVASEVQVVLKIFSKIFSVALSGDKVAAHDVAPIVGKIFVSMSTLLLKKLPLVSIKRWNIIASNHAMFVMVQVREKVHDLLPALIVRERVKSVVYAKPLWVQWCVSQLVRAVVAKATLSKIPARVEMVVVAAANKHLYKYLFLPVSMMACGYKFVVKAILVNRAHAPVIYMSLSM